MKPGSQTEPSSVGRLPRLRHALLAWYERSRRDLPWRATRDPYRIWVSEIMLQQTRVAAVLPRYEKFLRRFPSVKKLAAAREASVLAEWSGLGYYRRARNLRAAARDIDCRRGGKFPQTAQAWRELPGIGRYTAAAISSIAFNEPVAVLDGNVERVIRRLSGRALAGEEAWNTAEVLLDRGRPGDFNQAMMELGATVCVPGEPKCAECPLQRFCRTRGMGKSDKRPESRQKQEMTYALTHSDSAVFLVQRPRNHRLMAGMWQLPTVEKLQAKDKTLFTVRHSITNTDYVVSVVTRSDSGYPEGTWVRLSRLGKVPLTGLTKKILRRAQIIK